MRIIKVGKTSR